MLIPCEHLIPLLFLSFMLMLQYRRFPYVGRIHQFWDMKSSTVRDITPDLNKPLLLFQPPLDILYDFRADPVGDWLVTRRSQEHECLGWII